MKVKKMGRETLEHVRRVAESFDPDDHSPIAMTVSCNAA